MRFTYLLLVAFPSLALAAPLLLTNERVEGPLLSGAAWKTHALINKDSAEAMASPEEFIAAILQGGCSIVENQQESARMGSRAKMLAHSNDGGRSLGLGSSVTAKGNGLSSGELSAEVSVDLYRRESAAILAEAEAWDAAANEAEFRIKRPRANQICWQSRLISAFTPSRVEAADDAIALAGRLRALYGPALLEGLATWESAIKVEQTAQGYANFRSGAKAFVSAVGEYPGAGALPLVNPDLSVLQAAIRKAYSELDLGAREQAIQLRSIPIEGKHLRVYLRGEYTVMGPTDGLGAEAGVSYRRPFGDQGKPALLASELSAAKSRLEQQLGADLDEVARQHYEYSAKLSIAVKLRYQQAVVAERLRQAFIELDTKPVSRVDAERVAQALTDWHDVRSNVLDIRQNLYLRLAQMWSLAGEQPISGLNRVAEPKLSQGRDTPREVVIPSSTFSEHTDAYLTHSLKAKGASGGLVPASASPRLSAFKEMARDAGLAVTVRLPITSGLTPAGRAALVGQVRALPTGEWAMLTFDPNSIPGYSKRREHHLHQLRLLLAELAEAQHASVELLLLIPDTMLAHEIAVLRKYPFSLVVEITTPTLNGLPDSSGIHGFYLREAVWPTSAAMERALTDLYRNNPALTFWVEPKNY